jgi:hypothetical protein
MKIASSLLNQLVTVQQYQGQGSYEPVYSDPETTQIRCNISSKTVQTTDANGDTIQAQGPALFAPDADLHANDRLTASDGTIYRIVEIGPVIVGKTVHHLEGLLKAVATSTAG